MTELIETRFDHLELDKEIGVELPTPEGHEGELVYTPEGALWRQEYEKWELALTLNGDVVAKETIHLNHNKGEPTADDISHAAENINDELRFKSAYSL